MEKIVEVKNLDFYYGNEKIMDGINFYIEKGDYFGVVGPNGAGKSTLLKILLGILKPNKGEIKLFGKSFDTFKDWNKIGYVSQKSNSFNIKFPSTVEEIIYFTLKSINKEKKNLKEKAYRALDLVDMLEYKNSLIGNLSGGQQQRVFIARALATNPQLLFLDEPTVGIDYKSQEIFYNIMDKLNNLGVSICMISHDIGVIINRVNKVACIGNGNVYVHYKGEIEQIKRTLSNVYGQDIHF